MPTLYITDQQTNEVNLDGIALTDAQVTETGSLTTTGTAIAGADNTTVTVDGSVRSETDAIDFFGATCSLTVGTTGILRGNINGVYLANNSTTVINNGQISGSLQNAGTGAIVLDGTDNTVLNAGLASGFYGIYWTGLGGFGNANRISNTGQIQATDTGIILYAGSTLAPFSGKSQLSASQYGVFNSGSIIAGVTGINVQQDGDVTNSGMIKAGRDGVVFSLGDTSLINSGTISAQHAVLGSIGRDTIINTGLIDGGISLDDGNDVYDGRHGTVTGVVDLSLGDDVGYGGAGNETLNGGSGKDTLYGEGGNDSLVGGLEIDYLDGGQGSDRMEGGGDSDTYVVDDENDVVVERSNEGTDSVLASISYTLAANVENLVLTGAGDLAGTGNGLANTITGNAGSNILDGGTGADILEGRGGNDTYIVDDAGDVVIERADEGIDTVRASVSYALGADVENLVLTGTADIDGTGNDLANTMTGNAGRNRMDGGAGADILVGGEGDDIYVVDHAGDLVTERAGEGTDRVQSSLSYALGAHVENLTLTGSGDITGIGNDLANAIIGNSGNNLIDGGAGADVMSGAGGNDTYVVDDAGDQVIEGAGQGIDTVRASVSYALGADIENLVLTGAGDLDGTGNDLSNAITGNGGANRIRGGVGNDFLDGGAGQDTAIFSGLRSEYVFTRNADGSLIVADGVAGRDDTDTLRNFEFLQFSDGTIEIPSRAPAAPALQGLAPINENAAPFTMVATAQAPGFASGGVTFALTANPGGKFYIDPANGQIMVVGAIDYEATNDPGLQTETVNGVVRKFYLLKVTATETLTNWTSAETSVKVYVNDVNEAPTGLSFKDGSAVATIGEDAADGAVVGDLQAFDPEGDTGLIYAFDTSGHGGTSGSGNAGGRFKIEGGQLKVAALTDITKPETYTVTLKVTDENGGPGATSSYKDFLITVNPVGEGNTPPNAPSVSQTISLSENSGPVDSFATALSTDDGNGGALEYEIVGNPGNLFTINPATGEISFAGGANYDAGNIGLFVENPGQESEAKYFNVVVRARESGPNGLTSTNTTVKVYLNDVNEAPSAATYSVHTVGDKASAGETVATLLSVTDPDTRPSFRSYSYKLVNEDGSDYTGDAFTVDANGTVKVGSGGMQDVDAPTATKVFVKISDSADPSLSTTEELTVTVTPGVTPPPNHAPTDVLLSSHDVRELSAAGDFIGTLSAVDEDTGDSFTYALLDDAGGRFRIVNGHDLVVDNGFKLDFEQASSHRITVRATDQAGAFHDTVIDLNVLDWNPEVTGGSADHDVFYGGALNDLLRGNSGNDRLFGGAGADKLYGDVGNDTLGGGAGKDKLYGGKGKFSRDFFVFDTKLTGTKVAKKHVDKIFDFGPKYDSIGFDDLAFTNKTIAKYVKKKGGATLDHKLKIDKGWFVVGDKALDGNDFFIYNDKTHTLYYDADGSGHKAMVAVTAFAAFEKKSGAVLTYNDLFLV